MTTGENGVLLIDRFINRMRTEEKSSALKMKALQILPSVCETHFIDVLVLSPRPVRVLPEEVRTTVLKATPPKCISPFCQLRDLYTFPVKFLFLKVTWFVQC